MSGIRCSSSTTHSSLDDYGKIYIVCKIYIAIYIYTDNITCTTDFMLYKQIHVTTTAEPRPMLVRYQQHIHNIVL